MYVGRPIYVSMSVGICVSMSVGMYVSMSVGRYACQYVCRYVCIFVYWQNMACQNASIYNKSKGIKLVCINSRLPTIAYKCI